MVSKEDLGNKVAQTKISKTVFSKHIREMRIMDFKMNPEKNNKNICDECGFRIRNENHLEGGHHKGTVTRPRKRH